MVTRNSESAYPKPNLFIVGAMKSGTTSLHNYLKMHSDIFMSEPKELWYFVEEKNWRKGEQWYLEHFRDAGSAVVIGESSADYTMYPFYKGVPDRLHAFNPDAKLIYLMRDPVERAVSHYWYDVRIGLEKRSITRAVYSEPKYIYLGNYATQLKLYFQLFNREQVYIETFEKMVTDPGRVVNDIIAWLGLNPDKVDTSTFAKKSYNATPNVVEQVKGLGIIHALRHSSAWDFVHPFVPEFLIEAGRRMGYRKIQRKKETSGETVDYLHRNLAESTSELARMLERNFPEWSYFKNI